MTIRFGACGRDLAHCVVAVGVCQPGRSAHARDWAPTLGIYACILAPIMPGGAAAALRGAAAVHDTGIVTLLRMHMHGTFCATLAYAIQRLAWQTQAPKLLICQVVC